MIVTLGVQDSAAFQVLLVITRARNSFGRALSPCTCSTNCSACAHANADVRQTRICIPQQIVTKLECRRKLKRACRNSSSRK